PRAAVFPPLLPRMSYTQMYATDAARARASVTLTARWTRSFPATRLSAAPPAGHTVAEPRITTAPVAVTASAAVTGGRSGGRNVPTAASANSQPLGLANW